jgi:isoleucyl-tRNA synthetase
MVLTHGFVVDGSGRKMSKSLGNVMAPQDIIQKYGADILRLWVAMSDYREDVRLSPDIIKQGVDTYRRFRNTFRFLLQNTADFKLKAHQVSLKKLEEIDRWILVYFEDLKSRVLKAYDGYQFHLVLSELNRFISVILSGFYLDALKDWLYCEKLDSPRRRSSQTAFFHLTKGLSVLLAPLLSFTSEEAYLELKKQSDQGLSESVFLEEFSSLLNVPYEPMLHEKWLKILQIRGMVNDELDKQRKAGVLKSSQEAAVHLNPQRLEADQGELLLHGGEDWPFILQMSEVFIDGKNSEAVVTIQATQNAKCERCWRHRSQVGQNKAHPTLCGRCADVILSL